MCSHGDLILPVPQSGRRPTRCSSVDSSVRAEVCSDVGSGVVFGPFRGALVSRRLGEALGAELVAQHPLVVQRVDARRDRVADVVGQDARPRAQLREFV